MTEFTYKFIDLPNIEKIGEIVWRHIPPEEKNQLSYRSSSVELFSKCKPLVEAVEVIKPWSDVREIGLVIVKPNSKLYIHTDLGELTIKHKYALNFPIYNTENVYTVFYKAKDNVEGKITYQEHGDPFVYYEEQDVYEIDRMNLTRAAFVNTQILHTVINPTTEPRAAITLRFNTPFDFTEIYK